MPADATIDQAQPLTDAELAGWSAQIRRKLSAGQGDHLILTTYDDEARLLATLLEKDRQIAKLQATITTQEDILAFDPFRA